MVGTQRLRLIYYKLQVTQDVALLMQHGEPALVLYVGGTSAALATYEVYPQLVLAPHCRVLVVATLTSCQQLENDELLPHASSAGG